MDADPRDLEPDELSVSSARIHLAEQLLQEAVYRSRGEQSGAALLRAPRALDVKSLPSEGPSAAPPSAARPSAKGQSTSGRCGLGEKAAVVLDLTPRAEALFAQLFPTDLDAAGLEALRGALAAWVRRQDALDRRRNHFLKDFRNTHGFERSGYDAGQLAAFEEGLARINTEALVELRQAAEVALSASDS